MGAVEDLVEEDLKANRPDRNVWPTCISRHWWGRHSCLPHLAPAGINPAARLLVDLSSPQNPVLLRVPPQHPPLAERAHTQGDGDIGFERQADRAEQLHLGIAAG